MKKHNNKHKKMLRSLLVVVICFIVTAVLELTGAFSFFENKTYDQRMVFASNFTKAGDQIYFIGVDQESIDWASENYGWSWPWPREAWAKMIDFLSAGNPASIAFDIVYTEPSIYGEADDAELARAEADSKKVIQTVFITGSGENEKLLYPIPQIKDNAALIGNITSLSDKDGVIRKGRLSYTSKGITFPTLGTAPLYLEDSESAEEIISNAPILKDGSVLLRYSGTLDTYDPIWASDIFKSYDAWKSGQEGIFIPGDFEDSYIYIAYYAPGLFDICSTPVSQVYPGVGVHITTLDNLLNDSFIRKVPVWICLLWILVMAGLGSYFVTLSSVKNSQRITVTVLCIGFVTGILLSIGLSYLLFAFGIWLKLVSPLCGFLLAYLATMVLSFTVEGKQKRFIKSAFSQCLSKEVVNQILSDPNSFTLGGKNYQMTAIFSDIQKFSSFSELLTASQLGKLLNYYLTKMSEIIIAEKGTVDKYEGDAIVAMVGAPVEMEDHAIHAVSAAIKMKKIEELMNAEIKRTASGPKPDSMDEELYAAFKILVQNNKTLFTRIGINSGEMIAGYFGSENKKNYTMMGNNVNLASRLEGVNKQYHTGGILISEATRNLLGENFTVRSLDKVRVVNVNTPIRLYEVLDFAGNAELENYVSDWEKAMLSFENDDYEASLAQFKSLKEKNSSDFVAEYYIHIIETYFTKGKFPVEADGEGVAWDAESRVFNLLQK